MKDPSLTTPNRAAAIGLVAIALATPALGQFTRVLEGEAVWRWEVSTDLGRTWQGGAVEVGRDTPSVRVRASCFFERRDPRWYYGGAQFDARVSGVGAGDQVTDYSFGSTLFNAFIPLLSTQRFGSELKVDYQRDVSPPGLGSSWLAPINNSPQVGGADLSHPIVLMEYTLLLDQTLGDRTVDAVFRRESGFAGVPNERFVLVYEVNNLNTTIHQTLVQHPVVVRVIPSPSGLAVLVGLAWTSRRRADGRDQATRTHSRSTSARTRSRRPQGVLTSTGRPSNWLTCDRNAARSNSVTGQSNSTRRPTSLSGRSSPLATDPKTETANTPKDVRSVGRFPASVAKTWLRMDAILDCIGLRVP